MAKPGQVQFGITHTCRLPGFGLSPDDLCPQCECDRLVELGIPHDIAWRAGKIRQLIDSGVAPPKTMEGLWEDFRALEREYGKEIP
jgi:hypothetical protein